MKPLFTALLSLSALTFDSSVAQASEREGIETRVVGHSRSDRADVEMDAFRFRPVRPNQCSLSRNAVQGSFGSSQVEAGHGLAYRLTNESGITLAVKLHWQDEDAQSKGLTRVDLEPGEQRIIHMYFAESARILGQLELQPARPQDRSESYRLEAVTDQLAPGDSFDQDSEVGLVCNDFGCASIEHDIPAPGGHGPHFQNPEEARAASLTNSVFRSALRRIFNRSSAPSKSKRSDHAQAQTESNEE